MKNIITFTLILFVTSGCGTTNQQKTSGTYQNDFNALQKVEANDGISQSEAYIIAKAFFWSRISGCGFPDEPTSEKAFWVSKTRIGYAGIPGDSIFINKVTGTITWGDKSKIVTLDELKKTKSNQSFKPTPKSGAV